MIHRWMALLMIPPLFALAGCNGGGQAGLPAEAGIDPSVVAVGHWIPASRPEFTTIDRDTLFAFVHSRETDTLVVEQLQPRNGKLTWLVTFPFDASPDEPVVLDGELARGWVLESPAGLPTHAAPLEGEVRINSVDEESINVTMMLWARGAEPRAGQRFATLIELDRQIDCALYLPYTPQYREMTTISGYVPPPPEKEDWLNAFAERKLRAMREKHGHIRY